MRRSSRLLECFHSFDILAYKMNNFSMSLLAICTHNGSSSRNFLTFTTVFINNCSSYVSYLALRGGEYFALTPQTVLGVSASVHARLAAPMYVTQKIPCLHVVLTLVLMALRILRR